MEFVKKMQRVYATGMCVCWMALFSLVLCAPTMAVVINFGDGTENSSPPEDDPGFANVGIINAGSGVYLGNRWVLTASHVGAGSITLGGIEYTSILDATVQLENPTGLSPQTDLMLLRLTEDPGLPSLRLGCRGVSVNTDVMLIGGGRDRLPEQAFWHREEVDGDKNDVWTLVDEGESSNESGYFTTSDRTVRWGTSRVSGNNFEANSGSGDVFSFQTDFLKPGPIVETSAQAVQGDSGGAVFQKNHGVWELVGLIHAVGLKENQPSRTNTAIFGGQTFGAELFDYADQIRSIADFEPAPGDFDGDGEITASDIDQMFVALDTPGIDSCHLDLTGNGTVSHQDLDQLLFNAGILTGDANLDGEVAFSDFLLLARAFGQEDAAGWANGDFDGDGDVTFGDFLLLSLTFGQSFGESTETIAAAAEASSVPEPSAISMFLVGLTLFGLRRRARRR